MNQRNPENTIIGSRIFLRRSISVWYFVFIPLICFIDVVRFHVYIIITKLVNSITFGNVDLANYFSVVNADFLYISIFLSILLISWAFHRVAVLCIDNIKIKKYHKLIIASLFYLYLITLTLYIFVQMYEFSKYWSK